MNKHVLKKVISFSDSHCMPCEETVQKKKKLRRQSSSHLGIVTKSIQGNSYKN